MTDRLAWWREARFGMFIHWGVYAVPAGQWQGKPVPGLGEWVMRNGNIPIPEYEQLAKRFNPVRFNAGEWVGIAKRAGMRYLVITAKHHDGFAMFRSPCNRYNIVDATPFGRDPMAELAEACRKAGIRLCFYYSQAQDWHAPGGAGRREECRDGNWWNPTVAPEAFARYLEDKAKPQVTELLTQYGPIGPIWFDTPIAIAKPQSQDLAAPDQVLTLRQSCDPVQDRYTLEIELPATAPDPHVSVLKLELATSLNVEEALLQQPDGRIVLPAYMGTARPTAGTEGPTIGRNGITEKWTAAGASLEWTFKLWQPGRYRVEVLTGRPHWEQYTEGHEVEFSAGGAPLRGKVVKHADSDSPRAQYFPEAITRLGEIELTATCMATARLCLTALSPQAPGGLKLSELHLLPV